MPSLDHQPVARESRAREITEADVVLHAAHSGDFYPHHLDVEFCRTQSFGQRIAHGTLTFVFAMALQEEAWPQMAPPTSFDRLRFVRPVHIGDRIRVRVTPIEADGDSLPDFLNLAAERCEVLDQDGHTVLVFEQSRPKAGASGGGGQ